MSENIQKTNLDRGYGEAKVSLVGDIPSDIPPNGFVRTFCPYKPDDPGENRSELDRLTMRMACAGLNPCADSFVTGEWVVIGLGIDDMENLLQLIHDRDPTLSAAIITDNHPDAWEFTKWNSVYRRHDGEWVPAHFIRVYVLSARFPIRQLAKVTSILEGASEKVNQLH